MGRGSTYPIIAGLPVAQPGQSNGLLSRGSAVQIRPGRPNQNRGLRGQRRFALSTVGRGAAENRATSGGVEPRLNPTGQTNPASQVYSTFIELDRDVSIRNSQLSWRLDCRPTICTRGNTHVCLLPKQLKFNQYAATSAVWSVRLTPVGAKGAIQAARMLDLESLNT